MAEAANVMQEQDTAQQRAQQALDALDAFLEKIHGGDGLRVLIEALQVLSSYVQQTKVPHVRALTAQLPPVGGVTLVRGGQPFAITDDELEMVRDAVNTRKREIRKRERREGK